MFEKEDKTFEKLRENSVNDWLSQIEKHDDLSVRGGVKATRGYIDSLKQQIDFLIQENEYKDRYLKKLISEKKMYPVIEYDGDECAVLNPDVVLEGETLGCERLIITFFPEVMDKLISENMINLVYTIPGENKVDIYKFNDVDVLITLGYTGCAACAGNLECFASMGVNKVIFCGGGGVLDKEISVGTLLLVDGAIRDEGFSYQYVEPSRVIYTDKELTEKVSGFLERQGIPYIVGLTWTTDCIFRETKSRVARRRAEGAKIVEMEQAGCIAVAKYKGIDYTAIIYGGDDVSGDEWDNRHWNSRRGIRYDLVMLCRKYCAGNVIIVVMGTGGYGNRKINIKTL